VSAIQVRFVQEQLLLAICCEAMLMVGLSCLSAMLKFLDPTMSKPMCIMWRQSTRAAILQHCFFKQRNWPLTSLQRSTYCLKLSTLCSSSILSLNQAVPCLFAVSR
jgi:hypothetical protein